MSFASILNNQPSETERPKPLPVGSYQCIVKGLPRLDKSAKKGTDFVQFTLQFQSAGEDVDPDSLEAALTKPSGEKRQLSEKSIKATYYLTEDALWRFKEFLKHLGLDIDGESKSYAAWLNETPNCVVGIYLKHVPSDDGEMMYADIGKTFKVD
jgi:hypothetical protein